jgi:hypothetical protein
MKVYTIARKNPSVFFSLLGISVKEFDILNLSFCHYLPNCSTTGRPHTLNISAHKLFFILFYYRYYMIQELLAFILRVDQAQVSRWISFLQLPFTRCTGKYINTARSQIKSLQQLKEICPEITVIIDASERPINRPAINQQRLYSGKNHIHSIKNQIIINHENKLIIDVSSTYTGRTHDFKVCKYNKNAIPKEVNVLTDTGFLGIDKIIPNKVIMPYKASKNFPLNDFQKLQNAVISANRVRVEHVLAHLKNYHILSNKFRGSKQLATESFKAIAGLNNFKILCRHS